MIRSMHKMLTSPIKRKFDDGGDFWDNTQNSINGVYRAPIPVAGGNPIGAKAPSTIAPLSINQGQVNTSPSSLLSSSGNIASSIMPFASNILNSFTKPPQPSQPHLDNPVTLRAPSYGAEKADVLRNINADTEGAARQVDGNTGAKIRLFNMGQKLERLGSINERESNAKIATQNEQARINSGLMGRNNDKLDRYGNEQVERQIAIQKSRSENISNFSDKVIGMQNENAKKQLDLDKTKVMSTLFSRSGVGDRERTILKKLGVSDPLGQDYSDLEEKKANGGLMGVRYDHSRGFYRNIPVRAQSLKSLYRAPN